MTRSYYCFFPRINRSGFGQDALGLSGYRHESMSTCWSGGIRGSWTPLSVWSDDQASFVRLYADWPASFNRTSVRTQRLFVWAEQTLSRHPGLVYGSYPRHQCMFFEGNNKFRCSAGLTYTATLYITYDLDCGMGHSVTGPEQSAWISDSHVPACVTSQLCF